MIRPLFDRIVVRRSEGVSVTAGGILLSQAHTRLSNEGEVVAVGDGLLINGQTHPLSVSVGDLVMFTKNSGTEITVDNEKLLVMKEEDVLGILDKGN